MTNALATTFAGLADTLGRIADDVLDTHPLTHAGTYRGFVLYKDALGSWQAWKDETGAFFVAPSRSEIEFMIDEDKEDDEAEFGSPLPVTRTEMDIDSGRFDDCRHDGSPDAFYDDALNGEED